MMTGLRRGALAGCLVLTFSTLSTAPAHAATTWQTGVKVAKPNWFNWADYPRVPLVESSLNLDCDNGSNESVAAIKLTGDYMYVGDTCGDGRSAVGMVSYASGGATVKKICRNKSGNNTWARCNFDWPEGAAKQFTAGVYNGDTGFLRWDHGKSIYFSD